MLLATNQWRLIGQNLWVLCLFCLTIFFLVLQSRFPGGIWADDDYAVDILASACNFNARIADATMYPAWSMAYHPAVQKYIVSGLIALATLGSQIGSDLRAFDRLMDHANEIYSASKLAATGITIGSLALYAFWGRRIGSSVAVIVGIVLWFTSSSHAIIRSILLSTETFSLLGNALLMGGVLLLISQRDRARTYVLCGLIAAFGYFIKIHFIYIYLALLGSIICANILYDFRWQTTIVYLSIFHVVAVAAIAAVGYGFIGSDAFQYLIKIHKLVFVSSDWNGPFQPGLFDITKAWEVLVRSWTSDGALAIFIALFGGALLLLIGLFGALLKKIPASVSIVAIAAGIACVASALAVLKHYSPTYVAGVSATLPFLVLGWCRLCKAVSFEKASLGVLALVAAIGASSSIGYAVLHLSTLENKARRAADDERALGQFVDLANDRGLYFYRVPMRSYGEGYVMHYCSTPPLQKAYANAGRPSQSIMVAAASDFRYLVVDKSYFPTREDIVKAEHLDPLKFEVGRYNHNSNDRFIELLTTWLIVRAPDSNIAN